MQRDTQLAVATAGDILRNLVVVVVVVVEPQEPELASIADILEEELVHRKQQEVVIVEDNPAAAVALDALPVVKLVDSTLTVVAVVVEPPDMPHWD